MASTVGDAMTGGVQCVIAHDTVAAAAAATAENDVLEEISQPSSTERA